MKVKPKTRKSISKRFKFTRGGKIMRRIIGQMHYRAKNSPRKRRELRRLTELSKGEAKRIKKSLTY